jgi:hypothetical protein
MPVALAPNQAAAAQPAAGSRALGSLLSRGSSFNVDSESASWMSQDAAAEDLLYVSGYSWVSVYTYPQGVLVGKLKGFRIASGQCVDSKSNIYITDYGQSRVYEYAHGSRTRMRTIFIPNGPFSCSIDPTTGNLAVSSLGGGVRIFKNARGDGIDYKDSNFNEYFGCGYDPNGNLFVDGLSQPGTGHFVFAELPKGGSQLQIVTLNQYIGWPGGVQWHYKYLAVGDQSTPAIYQFVIKGSKGTKVGTTHLGSKARTVEQFWIQGQTVVAPTQCYGACDRHRLGSEVMFFRYPAGGAAIKKIIKGFNGGPIGASVSLAPG